MRNEEMEAEKRRERERKRRQRRRRWGKREEGGRTHCSV